MARQKRIYKRHELKSFISGHLEINSQLVETSPLKIYHNSDINQISPEPKAVFLSFALILVGLVCLMNCPRELSAENYLGLIGLASLVVGLSNFRALLGIYKVNYDAWDIKAQESIEEIIYLRDYMCDYLKDLDGRTRKYFNCITNNKVANYLLLTNIKLALQEKVCELKQFKESSHKNNIFELDKILRGNISVYDGVGLNSGNLQQILLAKLAETIDVLVMNMEENVKTLEDDMKVEVTSYPYSLEN